MGLTELGNEITEKVKSLEEYFRGQLPDFQIGVSKSAHYKNGQTGDLAGGREFQFYRPSAATPEEKLAAHRLRISQAYLEDTPLSKVLAQLENWKVIEQLNRHGQYELSVSHDGVTNVNR